MTESDHAQLRAQLGVAEGDLAAAELMGESAAGTQLALMANARAIIVLARIALAQSAPIVVTIERENRGGGE